MGQLEKRRYGKTGEQVTVLGLGGGSLNKYSYDDGVATVRHALDLGVTYFDTSVMYGHGLTGYGTGVSQVILGDALEGRSESYLLATKVGHFSAPARFRSADAIRTQIDESLRLLRRDSVDVLQIHEADWHWWWTDEPPAELGAPLDLGYDYAGSPVMEVLREARSEGLCRSIGITANSSHRLGQVLSRVDVDACLCAYNYSVFRRNARRDLLPLARDRGTAVILGGIFQGYQESDPSPRPVTPAPVWSLLNIDKEWLASPTAWMSAELRAGAETLYSLQRESGLSMLELVMGYMLGDRGITTLLIGAASPSEIEQSVRAAERGPLPADLHQAIEVLGDRV